MISFSYALTYSVKVPTGTNECYIAGEMTDWEHKIMNKIDETHFSIDIPNAKIAHKYKYCSGPGWGYVEKDAKGEEIYNKFYHIFNSLTGGIFHFDLPVPKSLFYFIFDI